MSGRGFEILTDLAKVALASRLHSDE